MAKHLAPPKAKHAKKANSSARVNAGEAGTAASLLSKIRSKLRIPEEGELQERKRLLEGELDKKSVIPWAVAALLFAAGFLLPLEGWLERLVFLLPLLLAGYPVFLDAWHSVRVQAWMTEELLLVLAVVLALCLLEFPAAALMMLLYRAAVMLQLYALGKSRSAFAELMNFRPMAASVETEDGIAHVEPEAVEQGQILLVSPGERIPLDGIVVEGISTLDHSAFTGVETLENVSLGSKVLSGCVNLTSPIKVQVRCSFADSTATKILDIARQAASYSSRQERFASRFVRYYVPTVLLCALILALVPPIFAGGWLEWLRRALVFLAVSGPCALRVSVPLAYFGALSCAYQNGVLVKGSRELELLAKARTFVLDKTGTITEGRYILTDVFPEKVTEEQLLNLAAAVEFYSDHAIARAICCASDAPDPEDGNVLYVEDQPGLGVSAFVRSRQVYVGNASLLASHGIACTTPKRAGTAVHVAVDGVYWGYLLLSDKMRDGAFDALEALRRFGANNLVLLTGDVLSVARPIASSLNFDMVKGELLPQGKVSAVEYLLATKAENSSLVFVGDGESDTDVLQRADVGIAMGAQGSAEALAAADVMLLDEDIRKLPLALKIARETVRIARINIAAVLGLKALILLLAVFGWMPLILALLADFALTAFALLNALRTMKIKR